jgi:toxin ParE1/3/4
LKRARLRPQAETDLVSEAQYYAKEGGADLAERMFDAALKALAPIERMPAIGSPRVGHLCDIPGLRACRVEGLFPLQWFYFEASDHLDVVRLLGDRQDIAGILDPVALAEPPRK